jgi:hypothetical protein
MVPRLSLGGVEEGKPRPYSESSSNPSAVELLPSHCTDYPTSVHQRGQIASHYTDYATPVRQRGQIASHYTDYSQSLY